MSVEESLFWEIDFRKLTAVVANGMEVVPVVVQDVVSGAVLTLAYANELALLKSLETGVATFWSTSRNEIWIKGENSGDFLEIIDIKINCEQNSLMYLVRMVTGLVCHTKRKTCYYRAVSKRSLYFVE